MMVAQYSWNYGDCEDIFVRFRFGFHSEYNDLPDRALVVEQLVVACSERREKRGLDGFCSKRVVFNPV
ncbi:hypothetical protein Pan241w_10060 [Gimesia alba]|uniref:Uncharacterized protein n=1 Tax=Gimesia alba TaxID=2527973 RepID=A0A517RAN1_9PLAN|nr:hypothetical protein Pan241w_10060 [Gimesia alba]